MAKSFLDIADEKLHKKKEEETTTKETPVVDENETTEEVLENTEEKKEDKLDLLDNSEQETEEEEETTEEETTEEQDETSTRTDTTTVEISTSIVPESESSKIEKSSESTYESDWAKKYDEYYKQYGGSPEDFIEATKDYSSLSQEEVIKKSIKLKNPDFTRDEIDFEYEDLYKYDEEYDEERDIKRKKINFKKALREANHTVSEFQKKFFIKKTQPVNGISEEQKAAIEEQNRIWRDSVEKVNAKIDGITIKVSDDFSFKHKITTDAKTKIKEIAADTSMIKYIEKYKVNENQLDVEKLQRDLFVRDNFEEIIADAIDQGRQYERALIKKQEKNIDFSGSKQPRKKKISIEKQSKIDLLKAKYNIK